MKVQQLLNKFRDAPLDTILERGLILTAKVSYVPSELLNGEYIILEDETGKLDAAPERKKIYDYLKTQENNGASLKLKGYLGKTEFGNIAFAIEEILE